MKMKENKKLQREGDLSRSFFSVDSSRSYEASTLCCVDYSTNVDGREKKMMRRAASSTLLDVLTNMWSFVLLSNHKNLP